MFWKMVLILVKSVIDKTYYACYNVGIVTHTEKFMKRFKMILALTVIASALSACGTVGGAVSGMGQDLSKAGDWIKNK